MLGVNFKKIIEDALNEDMNSYLEDNNLSDIFEMPILGYADGGDVRFSKLYEAEIISHPKEIYRPTKTVIVSFLPFKESIVKDNYIMAYEKSILVSSHINGVLMHTLTEMGREASLSNIPSDWDNEKMAPEWNHKIAAYIANMGPIGPAGSIKTKRGSFGRFNSLLTEVAMEPTSIDYDGNIEDFVQTYLDSAYKNINDDIIEKCPVSAISSDGIDRKKCQTFCQSLGQTIPEPDACAKCYLYC